MYHDSMVVEAVRARTDRRGPDECWPWRGKRAGGYGKIRVNGRLRPASQVVWEIANDQPFPEGKEAAHTCDWPPCVNDSHIFPATHAENIADAVRKGHMRGNGIRGDAHWMRTHPENLRPQKGDEHWTHRMPERVHRGDAHPSRSHPEKFAGNPEWKARKGTGPYSRFRVRPGKAHGERHPGVRLTEAFVLELRARAALEPVNAAQIAREQGVHENTITAILRGETWRHLL